MYAVAQGARREVETALKSQGERLLSQMDLVQRDEFEAVKEMASKARLENEALRKELELLKASLSKPVAKRAAKPATKPATKPAAKPATKRAVKKKPATK